MKKLKLSGSSAFIIGNILFGVTGPLTKFIFDTIPLNIYMLPKFLIPGIVVWLVARKVEKPIKLTSKQYMQILGLGILNVTLSNILFYVALERMPALYAMLSPLIFPIFVYVLAVLILKEKISLKALISVIVSFVGVTVLFVGSHERQSVETFSLIGLILLLGSVLASAYGTVLSKPLTQRIPILQFTSLQLIIGSIFFIPQFLVSISSTNWGQMPWTQLLVFALLCLAITPIGYIAYFWGIKKVNVEGSASILYVAPVAGIVVSVILLDERLSYVYIASVVLIMFGIWIGHVRISKLWIELQRPVNMNILELIKNAFRRLKQEL